MATLPPPHLPDLAAWLRRLTHGSSTAEAAVELLIRHRRWLERPDFHAACLYHDTHLLTGEAVTGIDFDAVPAFLDTAPHASSEASILRLAAELAGTTTGHPLADLLTSLDAANTRLALHAVTHATGTQGQILGQRGHTPDRGGPALGLGGL